MFLAIADLVVDDRIQARVNFDADAVNDYAEALENGATFPPVVVFHDGERHWLADGFHRVAAFKKAGREEIECDIRSGTQRDAILFAVGANSAHGLRRSNSDKRKAVSVLLEDPEWSQWTDREIARRCGVSNTFVSSMRREGAVNGLQSNEDKDRDAGLALRCSVCGEIVDCPVWHCPGCGKHLVAESASCGDCETERPTITPYWVVVTGKMFLTPFGDLLPQMAEEQYAGFRESIRRWGIAVPIVLDQHGAVLDGRKRLLVAAELALDPPTRVISCASPQDRLETCVTLNLLRRSVPPKERDRIQGKTHDWIARCAETAGDDVREDDASPDFP
jgi:ParB-like chromosome segregation protein Spo0J